MTSKLTFSFSIQAFFIISASITTTSCFYLCNFLNMFSLLDINFLKEHSMSADIHHSDPSAYIKV